MNQGLEDIKCMKGTTTVGLVCSDGVILTADKRASMGYLVANKNAKKIYKIDDNLGLTIAGMVADAQELVRILKAQVELYKVTREADRMNVEQVTTLLSNVMYAKKIFPYYVQLLLGGVDTEPRLYSFDPFGGIGVEDRVATGSGSPIAYGVLEDRYKKKKTVENNLPIAVKALRAAMERDIATGDGISVTTVTEKGYKEHTPEEIKEIEKSV